MNKLFAGFIAGLGLLGVAATASAGTEDTRSNPGYVDFAALTAEYGQPRVMVNLGSSLLNFARAMGHSDPAADMALKSLESVRIHVYDTEGDTQTAEARMQAVAEQLAPQDWEQVIRVRESDEAVDIFLKQSGERVHGVVIMAVDGHEAVFINLLGDIDPAQLGAIVKHVDVDVDVDL